jgi:DNA-binding response OmpR family regulator
LDVIISKIRSKLEDTGKIKSIRSIGYKLLWLDSPHSKAR